MKISEGRWCQAKKEPHLSGSRYQLFALVCHPKPRHTTLVALWSAYLQIHRNKLSRISSRETPCSRKKHFQDRGRIHFTISQRQVDSGSRTLQWASRHGTWQEDLCITR
jgi:hypothetical protein